MEVLTRFQGYLSTAPAHRPLHQSNALGIRSANGLDIGTSLHAGREKLAGRIENNSTVDEVGQPRRPVLQLGRDRYWAPTGPESDGINVEGEGVRDQPGVGGDLVEVGVIRGEGD